MYLDGSCFGSTRRLSKPNTGQPLSESASSTQWSDERVVNQKFKCIPAGRPVQVARLAFDFSGASSSSLSLQQPADAWGKRPGAEMSPMEKLHRFNTLSFVHRGNNYETRLDPALILCLQIGYIHSLWWEEFFCSGPLGLGFGQHSKNQLRIDQVRCFAAVL